ncbi:MAG: hypothetical protein Q9220_002648 [cf. Caloplaca sp. 1 TL-2023]
MCSVIPVRIKVRREPLLLKISGQQIDVLSVVTQLPFPSSAYASSALNQTNNNASLDNMTSNSSGQNGFHAYEPEMSQAHRSNGFHKSSSHVNGASSPAASHRDQSRMEEQTTTVLIETVTMARTRFIADFDDVDEHYIQTLTIEEVLEYIEHQRLTHMPHRGSHWDKVLKWAEFFALQHGPDNARALETTFAAFYRLGLTISFLLRRNALLTATPRVRSQVGYAFNDLLKLVYDVSLHYRASILGAAQSTNFDFNSIFGRQISGFNQRKAGIINAMWEHVLGHQAVIQIQTLRSWLEPADQVSCKLLCGDESLAHQRHEFTCEWFQSHFLAFSRSREDTLLLQGPAGCGKSILASWIVERLQRPLGKQVYDTIQCSIESDIPNETNSTALAKRLVLQLLDKNIGNKSLFHSLWEVHQNTSAQDEDKLEQSLWRLVDAGLDRYTKNDHLMIVVDGLDDVKGGQSQLTRLRSQLNSLSSRHSNVQIIVCSRDSIQPPQQGKVRTFEVTSDHTHEDIRLVINTSLQRCKHFENQGEHAQEKAVGQLGHAAKGSFLWATLATWLLKQESSHEGFNKNLATLCESPKVIDEIMGKIISGSGFMKAESQSLISWISVAERPLTVQEVEHLFRIDLQRKRVSEHEYDVDEVLATLKPIVSRTGGLVRFRHPVVRQYVLDVQLEGRKSRPRRESHTDLTYRLLAYCHFTLTKVPDPSLSTLNISEVESLFAAHSLLEYATSRWLRHFKASSLFQDGKNLQLTSDFKAVFPASTQFALLEWSYCEHAHIREGKAQLYELALQIRREVLSEKHRSVLQNLIACGTAYRDQGRITEASSYFYRASRTSQHVLRRHHSLIIACCTTFLTVTEKVTLSSRTEMATQKESLLRYLIDTNKHQHGKTHDLVIRYQKMLAQLYTDIHEEEKAELTWREVREIITIRFGKGSKEETSISEQLTVILRKGHKKQDLVEYEHDMVEIVTELHVWDERRIKITIELAKSYETRGEMLMAEELSITLWRRLTEQCHRPHHHHGVDIHIRTIEVVLEYVHFLRRCHRHEEAASVLICIWSEYEEYDFESEIIFLRLQTVGQLMREVNLLSVALAVFKKCLGWFKSHGRHEHTKSCEIMVSETTIEITRSVSTTTTSSTTTSTFTENQVKELFESTLVRTSVTSETITIFQSIISHHMRLEQWLQAIEVTRRSLSVIWKSIVSSSGTFALPKEHGREAIEIAIQLAICYDRSHRFYEAEEIYVRVYHACRNSCRVDDERTLRAFNILIKFYEEHQHWHKMIEVHKGMLVEYRSLLGPQHSIVIRTLYNLGSLCSDHGHGNAYEYYREIITVRNHDFDVCHPEALGAMQYTCRWLYEAGHWHELQNVCKILWVTWRDRHPGHEKFDAEFVEILYLRYRYVLEHHVHCEYHALRELIIEYRIACRKAFGVSAAITIKASIELAHISITQEKYLQEVISLYEEILTLIETTSKTTKITSFVTTTIITQIRQRLTQAYIRVCSHESASTQTIERAITVVVERYQSLRTTLGWASVETLAVLREVIHLHMKLKRQESGSIAVRMLLEATIEIITREKQSKVLHEAGGIVGDIFRSHGLTGHALDIVHELRLQIITKTPTSNKKMGIKLDKGVGRISFVFLVTLEQAVRESLSVAYAEVMADYLTESVLYESYIRSSSASATTMLGHVARLRAFLHRHKRHSQIERLDDESMQIFIKTWSLKAQPHIQKLFYISLLEQIGEEGRDINVGNIACRSNLARAKNLLQQGRAQEAYDITSCAFNFAIQQHTYHKIDNVPYGFKLSGLMVELDAEGPMTVNIETQLRQKMRQLSQDIVHEVIKACKEAKIEFVRFQLKDLDQLITVLGKQQNYSDLEWILELLWKSREVQKNWKSDTIISVGRLFVQARYLNASKERRSEAIRLCEDICYNLRRVWGSLYPETLKMSDLLSQLYTSMGHFREAQGVHESILRLIVEGDDGDDRTQDDTDSKSAINQVELLKQSFLRLHGWDKSPEIYKDLIHDIKEMPAYASQPEWKNVRPVSEWNPKEPASETLGKYEAPQSWGLVTKQNKGEARDSSSQARPKMNVKRVTSNWGMNIVHNLFHGSHGNENENWNGVVEERKTNGVNGVKKQAEIRDEEDGGYESAAEEVL